MANRYWVGGTGGWSDATNHWAATSGGSPDAGNLPTSADNVTVDANSGFGSGGTISLNGAYFSCKCNDFTSTSGHSYIIDYVSSDLSIYGSATLEASLTWSTGTYVYFVSSTTGKTITSNGCPLYYVSFGDQSTGLGAGGGWTLLDDMNVTDTFYVENGTVSINGLNVTSPAFMFIAATGLTPTINLGSGVIEATGYDAWQFGESNGEVVTINAGTSTLKFTNSSANDKTLASSGTSPKTYYDVWLAGTGTGAFIFNSNTTFRQLKITNPPHTLSVIADATLTVSSLDIVGTAGNLVTLNRNGGAGAGTQWNLSAPSGTIACDYLDISHSNATGGATWYAGANSTNTTDNTGWIFTDAPGPPPPPKPSNMLLRSVG